MKSILEQVYGVELSSQKVELGLVDDLAGTSKGVENFSNNIDIDIKELKEVKNSLNVDVKDLSSELNKLKRVIDDVIKLSKDLGINPKEIKGYSNAKNLLKLGEDKVKLANNFK